MSGPFGENVEVGVGFSDTALFIVAVAGFLLLACVVYIVMITRVKAVEELEREEMKNLDYEEHLANADVSTLNRAERRARARVLMRRNRRVDVTEGEDGEELHPNEPVKSRKERQREAKALEREERKLFEEERRKQQLEAQQLAQKEKRERERKEELRAEEEKRLKRQEKEEREKLEQHRFNIFLESLKRTQSVDDWLAEVREKKVIQLVDVANSFEVSVADVKARIETLIQERRVAGVFEGDGRFIYFSENELNAFASEIKRRGKVTLKDVADIVKSTT